MAIIWEKHIAGDYYKVTSAGATRRLYKNKVFHSQYNPKHIATGAIWDLLSLPALLLPDNSKHQALVLGVGGGAALHQLSHIPHIRKIVGVENDQIHLNIAKQYFGLNNKKFSLQHSCAKAWLNMYSGSKFDLIIDDLFYEEKGEPLRAINITPSWLSLLLQQLNSTGILVINTVQAIPQQQLEITKHNQVQKILKLMMPGYYNQIYVFLKTQSDAHTLRSRVKQNSIFSLAERTGKLTYSARTINSI